MHHPSFAGTCAAIHRCRPSAAMHPQLRTRMKSRSLRGEDCDQVVPQATRFARTDYYSGGAASRHHETCGCCSPRFVAAFGSSQTSIRRPLPIISLLHLLPPVHPRPLHSTARLLLPPTGIPEVRHNEPFGTLSKEQYAHGRPSNSASDTFVGDGCRNLVVLLARR